MLINRVVIQGFKTFAVRTEFVFGPDVTAIVGPNGSGKSNVVDAIRWCLGEQSFSLLRSKKTSDVIFSGSDRRARLGMAQVSLTLDNTGGEIPIDFNEVEITRRAYRDGNNEYLINGQRVRLQDITELLSQTGLGKRTYALIGQGLIDKVLSLSPEERRSLFEEAAGITAYQFKRKTTLRRLDATQQNLTRVQDIITELSPRLKYLRRQAERASEREQIAADLRDLLRIWYGYRWHAALTKLDQTRQQTRFLKKRVETRQAALTEVGKQIEGLRQRQTNLRSELGELHGNSSLLHRQAEEIGRELAVARERQRQIQARQEETQRELTPLHLQRETLQDRVTEQDVVVHNAQKAVEAHQTRVQEIQVELTRHQQERAEREKVLRNAREKLEMVQTRRTETRSRITQSSERSSILEQELIRHQQDQSLASEEVNRAAELLATAEKELHALEEQAASTSGTGEELEHSLVQARQALAAAEKARQEADRAADRLQTRHDLLQRLQREGAGYASGVRAVLQATDARSSAAQLSGILGTVGTLIQVPAELDKAIETALGGTVQNVVVDSWQETRSAIDFLKKNGAGRATFLPLDRLNVAPKIKPPSAPGILGNAADLVTFEADIGDVVEQLLGRVWVADDLSAARQALDRLDRGPRPTVVTLSGEIIRPGGAVTGGSDRRGSDDSILARERELRSLPALLNDALNQAKVESEQCSSLNSDVERLRVQLEEYRTRLADLGRQERQARERLEKMRRQHDSARQALQWRTERMQQTSTEMERLTGLRQTLEETQAELAREQSTAETELTGIQQSIDEAHTSRLLQQLADRRAEAAESHGQLRSQRTVHDSQQRNLQSVQDQIRSKQERIESLQREEEALKQNINEMSEKESGVSQAIEELAQKISPSEGILGQLEAEQNSFEDRERIYQRTLRQDETAWNAAELDFQRSEDTISQLRHEVEQDLGLVTLEESSDLAYQPPLPLDAVVEQLPVVSELPDGMAQEVKEMRARLSRVSHVNPDAPREYEEAANRYEYLFAQSEDLEAAASDLRKVIRELDELMEVELKKTFEAVAEQFVHFFKILFNGGTARLVLTEPENITETGIEIIARPPGKRPQSLALLSGGERTLSACALIFAILRVSPTPFCVLDEVDAALDEANVDRFRQTVEELSDGTQFIIITHNRRTLEGSNAIYGVTMGNDGISKVISLRLEGDEIVTESSAGDDDSLAAIEDTVQM